MVVANKSKYNAVSGFSAFRLPASDSYAYLKGKQNDLFVRSYYEFLDCCRKGGVVFFYTLTFNDANLCFPSLTDLIGLKDFDASWVFENGFSPSPIDVPCIDNTRFRAFCNGMFRKELLSKYDCTFKYVCCTEFGDGKGKRGAGFNPHLHVLFFVYPSTGIVPTHQQFDYLVKKYWQGCLKDIQDKVSLKFGYDPNDLINNKQLFINGIAQKSNINNGVVNSAAGICYVSKYVAKDSMRSSKIGYIHTYFINQLIEYYTTDEDSCIAFAKKYDSLFINDVSFNLDLFQSLLIDFHLIDLFLSYCEKLAKDLYYTHFYKLIKRLYLPKCYISNGIGLYGYEYLNKQTYTFHIGLPGVGILEYGMPLYYYRKFMCDVVKVNDVPTYVPNNDGLKFRVFCFKRSLENTKDKFKSYFTSLKLFDIELLYNNDCVHNKLIRDGFSILNNINPSEYDSCSCTLSCIHNFYDFYFSDDETFLNDFDTLTDLYLNVLMQRSDYYHYMSENDCTITKHSINPFNIYDCSLYPLSYLFGCYGEYLSKIEDKKLLEDYNKSKVTKLYHFQNT